MDIREHKADKILMLRNEKDKKVGGGRRQSCADLEKEEIVLGSDYWGEGIMFGCQDP